MTCRKKIFYGKIALVIYHMNYKECQSSYIGKTDRILFHRVEEHKGKSDSVIHEHHLATSHIIDFDKVKIINRIDSDFKLQFKEILQIDTHKPTLNKQLNSSDSYRIKTYIIGSKKI